MSQYPRLFEPFQLGNLHLPNRIVMLPHGTGMLSGGRPTENDDAYFAARARSGIGLIIAGGLIVHDSTVRRGRKDIEAYREESVEALRHKASVVKSNGARIVGQLLHLGRETAGGDFDDVACAPSPVRSPRDLFAPHELDEVEIASIVAGYAAAARHAKVAGFDGVEIHGAHGYLVAQFLSPATNFRQDAYGGDESRRFRFLHELIDAIRNACGAGFVLGLRLSADEELPDGNGVRETLRLVEKTAPLDAIDYLSITIGVRGGYVKDITWPKATAAQAAKAVRNACSIPVVVGQRITDPATAEQLLEDGAADLIGMARALIADAEWASAAQRGEAERIRPCVGLLQECRNRSPHLHCAVSPVTGREANPLFRQLVPAPAARRVAVIGGGPAGMEAARIAAERGYRVRLFEASDSLGGQFLYSASLPKRDGLLAFVNYQTSELRRLDVPVELDTTVRDTDDLGGHTDIAIVATGAQALPLPTDLAERGAKSCFDILRRGVPEPTGTGRAVVIDDGTGFWWTLGVAELISIAGWRVTIVAPTPALASAIPQESLGPLLARLGRGGTEYRVCAVLEEIGEGTVGLMNTTSGETETLECALVVIQTGRAATTEPAHLLREAGLEVAMIGDCVAPRRISHALFEAQRVARTL